MLYPWTIARRAAEQYVLDPVTGCHLSTYRRNAKGYAQLGFTWPVTALTTSTLAHRAAMQWFTGREVPPEVDVDHACHDPAACSPPCPHRPCVRREHLRELTIHENRGRTRR